MAARFPGWIAQYVGIPYRPGGRGRDGADCWGLVAMVMREQFSIALPDYPGAAWMPAGDARAIGAEAAAYAARFRRLAAGEERPGDAVLIRMRGAPLHVGLVVGDGWMLHAHEEADACLESYSSPAWAHRILGFYRAEPP
jgi:cell wall-associated NlpC family hydrolase